jgi:acyl-CoA thioesterase FadM
VTDREAPKFEIGGRLLEAPYVARHRVRFGESDSARIAYTGQFPIWALEAIEDWFDLWGDHDWYVINVERGFGTPFVRLEMDLKAALRPRDILETTVLIPKAGRSSIVFEVQGRRAADGVLCFVGTFTCVTAATPVVKAIPIPDDLRTRIEAYRTACAQAGAPASGEAE